MEKNYTAALCGVRNGAEARSATTCPPCIISGETAALANTNLSRGEEALKQYVAYTPKANEPPLASAHYYLGAVYEKAGKRPEAKQSYRGGSQTQPDAEGCDGRVEARLMKLGSGTSLTQEESQHERFSSRPSPD